MAMELAMGHRWDNNASYDDEHVNEYKYNVWVQYLVEQLFTREVVVGPYVDTGVHKVPPRIFDLHVVLMNWHQAVMLSARLRVAVQS